jgi:hypothetical protein
MVETIGTLAGLMRIHCGENGDLMNMVLAEHGDGGVGSGCTPGE